VAGKFGQAVAMDSAVLENPNQGLPAMTPLRVLESPRPPPSPLVLCDRLLTLAQDADRAGLAVTAEHLLELAHSVFEETPLRPQ
jgi:hypothetical protein